jgi:phage baseplate assembly protein W
VDPGRVLGRGIAFPPHIGADGRVAWSAGEVNVREAIRIILMTEQRERLRLPEFGGSLGQFLFEPNTVLTRQLIRDRITKALEQWEPRVRIESVTVEADRLPAGSQGLGDPQSAIATITYKLVATQVRERVSVNVTLAR